MLLYVRMVYIHANYIALGPASARLFCPAEPIPKGFVHREWGHTHALQTHQSFNRPMTHRASIFPKNHSIVRSLFSPKNNRMTHLSKCLVLLPSV
jgi:hypothetical protein